MQIKATVDGIPSAFGYALFQVNIYTFVATPQTDPEYLVGPNPLVHNLNPFVLDVEDGVLDSLQTVTYDLTLANGSSAAGAYSWLTVDLDNLQLTIDTDDEADTGIYDFELSGVYGDSD